LLLILICWFFFTGDINLRKRKKISYQERNELGEDNYQEESGSQQYAAKIAKLAKLGQLDDHRTSEAMRAKLYILIVRRKKENGQRTVKR